MEDAERLARAVLLFYNSQWVTNEIRQQWELLTDSKEITTYNLANLARRILNDLHNQTV
jgi:hypothetical protein